MTNWVMSNDGKKNEEAENKLKFCVLTLCLYNTSFDYDIYPMNFYSVDLEIPLLITRNKNVYFIYDT